MHRWYIRIGIRWDVSIRWDVYTRQDAGIQWSSTGTHVCISKHLLNTYVNSIWDSAHFSCALGSPLNILVSIQGLSHYETMIAPPITALWTALENRIYRLFNTSRLRAHFHFLNKWVEIPMLRYNTCWMINMVGSKDKTQEALLWMQISHWRHRAL